MIYREPGFYPDFRCLGGSCPLTCCRDWSIVVDQDALADYQNAPEPLRDRILGSLTRDDDGDVCFRLRGDGVCALLDEDGLCPIQRHWGEAHLCGHCGAYPRFIEEYGSVTESSIAISCPEGARLVLEQGVLPLGERFDGVGDLVFDGIDGDLFAGLADSRETAFRLVREPDETIWTRLRRLLDYADHLQDCVDWGRSLADRQPPELRPGRGGTAQALAGELLELLSHLEPLRQEWPALLQQRGDELSVMTTGEYVALMNGYQAACPQWETELERLSCYFLFRHWLKVVNDDQLYGRAALTAAACVALHHLAALAWRENGGISTQDKALLWAAFSREVEHLDENFDALVDTLADRERWPLAELL